MKKTLLFIIIIIAIIAAYYVVGNKSDAPEAEVSGNSTAGTQASPVKVTPIMHATALLEWSGAAIYADPTDSKLLQGKPPANIVLVTDIHGDHLSTTTLKTIATSSTLVVPQAVKDLLPRDLAARATVIKNGETIDVQGFRITGVPMYNLPEATSSRHVKGRGNGYVIERDGYRVYIAGDTAGVPEMRSLSDIDIAFVPMNLPFTMDVDEAADAVLDFKPKQVYPYHYRGQNGLANVNRFKQLVNAGDPDIEVILGNWYPTAQ